MFASLRVAIFFPKKKSPIPIGLVPDPKETPIRVNTKINRKKTIFFIPKPLQTYLRNHK